MTTTEQHVHGLLEQVPVMATSFLYALHWDQARALLGAGDERPRMALQRKRRPLPRRTVVGLVAAIATFGAVPYAEEILRCARAGRVDQAA